MQFLSLLLAGVAAKTVTAAGAAYQNGTVAAPTATTLNGTYQGRYLAEDWDQDLFLGIPFAQPPVGELRFKWPQSINESFSETRDASQYGYSCYQYGTTFNLSEDCLTLNGEFFWDDCLGKWWAFADTSDSCSASRLRKRDIASTSLDLRRRSLHWLDCRSSIQSLRHRQNISRYWKTIHCCLDELSPRHVGLFAVTSDLGGG